MSGTERDEALVVLQECAVRLESSIQAAQSDKSQAEEEAATASKRIDDLSARLASVQRGIERLA